MAQKKLIAMIARNSRGICMVALTSVTDARRMCQSIPRSGNPGISLSCAGRAGGDEISSKPPEDRDENHRQGCPFGMIAAIGPLHDQHAAQDRAAKDGDVGARLDQPGATKHFAGLKMLGKDGVFDRAEEGRVHAHCKQRQKQKRDIVKDEAGGASKHDQYFGAFDDPNNSRLVMSIRQLTGKGGQQEKGCDEQPAGNGAERRLLLGVAIDAIDYQHHHRGAEQVVVEGAQKLSDENRQESPRS